MRLVSAIYDDAFPFDQLDMVDESIATSNPKDLKRGDILVSWGGADISPSLYNKYVGARTGARSYPSHRDKIEWELMRRAVELEVPIIGVCRGGQMLCALAGGFLIQHVEGHFGEHRATTKEGFEITVNSIHHQMMYPFEVDHELLASVPTPLSSIHLDVDTNVPLDLEPEYVYFNKIKGFAIQWHPEMMRREAAATQYVFDTIKERI